MHASHSESIQRISRQGLSSSRSLRKPNWRVTNKTVSIDEFDMWLLSTDRGCSTWN